MSTTDGLPVPQPTSSPGVTRFVARSGHRLSYESSGPASGRPVLGLHDLLAERGQLRPLAAALVGDGCRVTLPDARGHGASSAISAREYPSRELAADALAILDAEGLPVIQVVAVGWGAGTALALAAAAPERVASLVLVEPYVPSMLAQGGNGGLEAVPADFVGAGDAGIAPTGPPRPPGDVQAHLDSLRAAAEAAAKGQIDRALDRYFAARLGSSWRDRLPKAQLAAARRSAANLGALLSGAIGERFDLRTLASIAVPVTLLLGEEAPALAARAVEVLAWAVPGTRIERITGDPADLGPGCVAAVLRALMAAR